MRNVRLGMLGFALFAMACATSSQSPSGRPNSASSMKSSQQAQPKDPHDFVSDPTIGSDPPPPSPEKPLCRLQCGPNMHCDSSGLVERCVRDEKPTP
jgi:hypothetical protein